MSNLNMTEEERRLKTNEYAREFYRKNKEKILAKRKEKKEKRIQQELNFILQSTSSHQNQFLQSQINPSTPSIIIQNQSLQSQSNNLSNSVSSQQSVTVSELEQRLDRLAIIEKQIAEERKQIMKIAINK